ncbi:MAG: alpha/beta hydrolase [Gammaproteobacteria bacterium]|nr:alpha/beta hydrolase [Gammaproteobacteria bacterium]
MKEEITPPGPMLRMLEGRASAEAAQLMLSMPLIRLQAKRGNGEPVVVLPGFMADDNSTFVLRQFLNSIGYRSYPWGLGVNRRKMLDFLPPIVELVRQLSAKHEQKVSLVGWSRGGILAREVARDHPALVDRVITIGSPVKGGTNVSSIGAMVKRETGLTSKEMSQLLRLRQLTPIDVPIRAIYSKLDGIVSWKACIDEVSKNVKHFEIRGSHIGMGTNAEVYRLLPKLLAEKI